MSWIWAILAVMLLSFTSFDEATAQPLGWSSQSYRLGIRHLESLKVFNMATGVVENTFEAPAGVHLGSGALTPDGRFYLVPTSVGIARFRTNPPSFDRIVGPPVAVNSVAVDPIGTRVHAVGDFGHAVLNWDTGTVSSVACCAQPRILPRTRRRGSLPRDRRLERD